MEKTTKPLQNRSENSESGSKSLTPPPFQLKAGDDPVQMQLADEDLVVRGGESSPENLKTNQAKDQRGHISANSSPGQGLDALATSPEPFPNGKISVSTVGKIRALNNDQGNSMDVIEDPTRNNPLHASIDPFNKSLSDGEAAKLSGAFTPETNRWKQKK